MKTFLKLLAVPSLLILFSSGSTGCSGGDDDDEDEVIYVQIERLGRPAINEALISTNAYLNAFNSIPPSADLSPDASVVVDEAIATLNAIDSLDGDDDVDPTVIAGAFFPDVMRIDTTLAIATSAQSFAAATGGSVGILTGGRKIEDDVVDVYYTVLTGALTGSSILGPIGDNVRYQGYPGLNAGQPGHKPLHGAAGYNTAATFPFLAEPN